MSCRVTIEGGPYHVFVNRIKEKATRDRIPISGSIELTANCNLFCRHCYIRPPNNQRDLLSTEDWIQILDKMAGVGCLWLNITGGEPLLRPDFPAIYLAAKKRGFLVTLFTNGTLVTPKIISMLEAYPPLSVEVSIYGACKETAGLVTGDEEAYDNCLRGVKLLLSAGIKTSLKTTLTKDNAGDLEKMKALAKSLGVSFKYDAILNAHVDPENQVPLNCRISPDIVVDLETKDVEKTNAWRKRKQSREAAEPQKEEAFGCSAGMTSFHVTDKGMLCSCVVVRTPCVDLRTESFWAFWNGPLLESVQVQFSAGHPCYHCEYASVCDTCPGFGLLEHGDSLAAVNFVCNIAMRRKTVMLNKGAGRIENDRK